MAIQMTSGNRKLLLPFLLTRWCWLLQATATAWHWPIRLVERNNRPIELIGWTTYKQSDRLNVESWLISRKWLTNQIVCLKIAHQSDNLLKNSWPIVILERNSCQTVRETWCQCEEKLNTVSWNTHNYCVIVTLLFNGIIHIQRLVWIRPRWDFYCK